MRAGKFFLTTILIVLLAGRAPALGLTAVCATFPVYDMARQVAGGDVRLLLPPGADPHHFEPRPSDMRALNEADLFVMTGPDMEPWAARLAGGVEGLVVNASEGILAVAVAAARDGVDPHVWLENAQRMVQNIAEGFCAVDPGNAAVYRERAEAYCARLAGLDGEFRSAVDGARSRGGEPTLVFGGRFACGWFLRRYGLAWVSAFEGEREPGVRRLADVVRYIREHRVRYVLRDEHPLSPVTRQIAERTGAALLLFHTAERVTREELEGGVTFLGLMRANLDAVRRALGVEPEGAE